MPIASGAMNPHAPRVPVLCGALSFLQDLSDKMSIQTLLRTNSSKSTYKPLSSKSTQGNFIKTEFK